MTCMLPNLWKLLNCLKINLSNSKVIKNIEDLPNVHFSQNHILSSKLVACGKFIIKI